MPFSRTLTQPSPLAMQEGFARLARSQTFHDTSLDTVLTELAESAGRLSGVERTSIWAFNEQLSELRCWERYELSSRRHSGGEKLTRENFPAYFEALAQGEAIVADDAYNHPSTLEFVGEYLPRHRVTAMLDTPIHIRGELQGVLRLEQVGFHHPWTSVHRLFAHAMANLVTLALVENEAAEARHRMQLASDRLQAVFEASRHAMLLIDRRSGLILDANRRVESLFGYHRAGLIGKPCHVLSPQGANKDFSECFGYAAGEQEGKPIAAEILCGDATRLPVEVTIEMADLEGGRRWALAIFRLPG